MKDETCVIPDLIGDPGKLEVSSRASMDSCFRRNDRLYRHDTGFIVGAEWAPIIHDWLPAEGEAIYI